MKAIRMVDGQTIHRLLDFPSLVEALRSAHRGAMPLSGRGILDAKGADGETNHVLALPAWVPGEALGIKLVTSFPGNTTRHDIPSVHGLYVVYDAATGAPLAIMDGTAMILRKTAATTALGADLLCGPRPLSMVMAGAGAVAPYVVEALLSVRPSIISISIWNRTHAKAEALAEQLSRPGVEISAVSDLDEAVARADVVVSATMATAPIIKGALLRADAHVGLIGSFTADMREGDDDLLRRSAIYVDGYGCLERSGEFVGPLAANVISRDDILGDLFELCGGKARTAAMGRQQTLFKNSGPSYLDLFAANHLLSLLDG